MHYYYYYVASPLHTASSVSFLCPLIYSILTGQADIALCSAVCLLASVGNHATAWRWMRLLDVIAVNTTIAWALFVAPGTRSPRTCQSMVLVARGIGFACLVVYVTFTRSGNGVVHDYAHVGLHLACTFGAMLLVGARPL